MSVMVHPESLPLEVLARVEVCAACETDRRPRMFVCSYHEGWWDGWEAGRDETPTAAAAVLAELRQATEKFGPFASAHEGYAVLLEEVDELWHEVKHGTADRQRDEAVQVAAMALRFLIDVTPFDPEEGT